MSTPLEVSRATEASVRQRHEALSHQLREVEDYFAQTKTEPAWLDVVRHRDRMARTTLELDRASLDVKRQTAAAELAESDQLKERFAELEESASYEGFLASIRDDLVVIARLDREQLAAAERIAQTVLAQHETVAVAKECAKKLGVEFATNPLNSDNVSALIGRAVAASRSSVGVPPGLADLFAYRLEHLAQLFAAHDHSGTDGQTAYFSGLVATPEEPTEPVEASVEASVDASADNESSDASNPQVLQG
jgi:hypothetical protein